eukprot:PhM_4_TR5739/c0_g1_i1/m.39020/K14568/EMG1, NEP1; rRNA small subunit pseudouridine methyltransferase Nep1
MKRSQREDDTDERDDNETKLTSQTHQTTNHKFVVVLQGGTTDSLHLIHQTLIALFDAPNNFRENIENVFIEVRDTYGGRTFMIQVSPQTHPPRTLWRFGGVIASLLASHKTKKPQEGHDNLMTRLPDGHTVASCLTVSNCAQVFVVTNMDPPPSGCSIVHSNTFIAKCRRDAPDGITGLVVPLVGDLPDDALTRLVKTSELFLETERRRLFQAAEAEGYDVTESEMEARVPYSPLVHPERVSFCRYSVAPYISCTRFVLGF